MTLEQPAKSDQPQKIGRYLIQSVLGRGGMAVVYLAYDPHFTRQVAVKVMPRELLVDPAFRARFLREAQTIATLEHPAIVPVYDYGEEDGQPYLVMRYMPGGSLDTRLKADPLSLGETASLYSRLAPALDEAHSHGVIHRDLKPGNILYDQRGDAFLSDFGIVKLAETTTSLTDGAIVGTPAYMSPEQGRGQKDIDRRADIYSLGAILFHLLTGRLPYQADTPTGQIICHINDPIPDILAVRSDLPYDIQVIINRSMAKRRDERYNTVSKMAQALAQVADEASQVVKTPLAAGRKPADAFGRIETPPKPASAAKPPSEAPITPWSLESPAASPTPLFKQPPAQPTAKPTGEPHARRMPKWLPAALAPLALLFVGVILVLGGWGIYRVVTTLANKPTGSAVAPTLGVAQSPVPGMSTQTAVAGSTLPSPTPTLLFTLAPLPSPTPVFVTLVGTPVPMPAAAITPENASQVVPLARWGKGGINQVAWSPDGTSLVVGTTIGIYIYDPFSMAEQAYFPTEASVNCLAFPPDGQILAVGMRGIKILLWRVSDWTIIGSLEGHTNGVYSLAFSPDGQIMASGSSDNSIILWYIATKSSLRTLEGHTGGVERLVFSADGKSLASVSTDRTYRVWEVASGRLLNTINFPLQDFTEFALSPDLNWLAIAGYDHAIHMVRTSDGVEERSLMGHLGAVGSMAFTLDSQMLASGSDDSVKVWRVSEGFPLRTLEYHGNSVRAVGFSSDGQYLASGSEDGAVRVWRLDDGASLAIIEGFTYGERLIAFSPERDMLASGLANGEIEIWRISDATLLRVISGHPVYINGLAFSGDGEILATSSDRSAIMFRVSDGTLLHEIAGGYDSVTGEFDSVTSLALSLDGNTLAFAFSSLRIVLWVAASSKFLPDLNGHTDIVTSLAFSPDGLTLASGGRDNTARIWNVAEGTLLLTLGDHTAWVTSVVYSPDGKTLATASRDSIVRVWRVSDGALLRTMIGHTGAVTCLDFSLDGALIISGSDDTTARIWRVSDGELLKTLSGHTMEIISVSFDPDGKLIATGSQDGTVRYWGVK